jgi:hypothetical protein
MDQWNANKLPERLPFSKKRLPKRVIFSCVAPLQAHRSNQLLIGTATSSTMSSSCEPPLPVSSHATSFLILAASSSPSS